MYKTCFILLLFSIVLGLIDKEKNYGQFELSITNLEVCKGPKRKDCSVYSARIKSKVIIAFDYLITENLSPTKGKVLAISNGNEVLRLQINKPCDNLFIKPVLQALFNITSNCIIRKGRYTFNLDFEEVLRKYYGDKHLYGNWTFRSVFYGDNCNFSCTSITVKINAKQQ